MYLTFEQVILVRDKSKLQPNDPVIYERELHGERILTLDNKPSKYTSEAKPYGHIYYSSQDIPCVVPESEAAWEADRMLAKEWC